MYIKIYIYIQNTFNTSSLSGRWVGRPESLSVGDSGVPEGFCCADDSPALCDSIERCRASVTGVHE